MKYARDTNATGSGFVDAVSCPINISMSGTTVSTTNISTQLRHIWGNILCKGEGVHNGNDLDFYFNSDYTDLDLAEYQWVQVSINSSNLNGTFSDGDSTFIDLWTTAYLSSDGFDDNFDSDGWILNLIRELSLKLLCEINPIQGVGVSVLIE